MHIVKYLRSFRSKARGSAPYRSDLRPSSRPLRNRVGRHNAGLRQLGPQLLVLRKLASYLRQPKHDCVTAHPTVSVLCCRHGVCAASVVDLCGQRRPSLAVRAVSPARVRPAIRKPGDDLSWTTTRHATQPARSPAARVRPAGVPQHPKRPQQFGIERQNLERPPVMLTTTSLTWLRTLAAFLCESSALE